MTDSDNDKFNLCVNRFIDLANSLKEEDIDINLISHALMTASSVYTTYALGGNEGRLTEAGVEKVTETYRHELERIQQTKKENIS